MTRAGAWLLLAGCAAFVVAPFVPGSLGRTLFVGVAVAFPPALAATAVAARRRGALGTGLFVLGAWLFLSAVCVVELSGGTGPSWTGLSPAGDWMLLGLGLAPLPLSIGLYVATFRGRNPSPSDEDRPQVCSRGS